jgi:membrane-associated phospholipid phosphatase
VSFFVFASILAVAMPISEPVRSRILGCNSTVLALLVLLVCWNALSPREFLSIARDWLPIACTLLAYQEMGWFALPQSTHLLELRWVVWDQALLRGGAKAAIELLGPVVPSILEVAYLLVYAMAPFSVAMLYAYDRRERVDSFLFLFLTGTLLCYAQFPFWPSQPPRVLFPHQDLPSYFTVFRAWNLWLLGKGGIHTSVFPSAHVAAAFSSAFGMMLYLPERKWVGRSLFVMALLIAVATVYGRYHYLADSVAGVAIACLCLFIARAFPTVCSHARNGTPGAPPII